MKELKNKGIIIHTLFIPGNQFVKKGEGEEIFRQIAQENKGKFQFLELDDKNGNMDLANLFCRQILNNIGKIHGINDLEEKFRKSYNF